MDIENAKKALEDFQALLDATPPDARHHRLAPGAWTLAEIVGHLVDSAGNNHQRFARLHFGDLEDFPGYDAEPWVEAQQYDRFDFQTLASLWSGYNALMLHLARTTPSQALDNAWLAGGERLTLGFLIKDYYRHLRLHTEHYEQRLGEVMAELEGSSA